MLDTHVLTRIKDYIGAELGPRDRTLGIALRDAQSEFVKHGTLNSSMAAQRYAQVGRDELAVRARIIWAAVRRSYESLVGPTYGVSTLDDLRQQISAFMEEQARIVGGIAAERAKSHDAYRSIIEVEIANYRRELVRMLDIEAQFFVDGLKRATSEGGTAPVMNFHGPVGTVQTGTFATAHVLLSGHDRERLTQALANLAQAIERNTEVLAEQKRQAAELVTDAVSAVKAQEPNPPKITGLLGGLAQTIQTVASLRDAWTLVRDAAIAAGLWLT